MMNSCEELRRTSEDKTRTSRIMARMMGQADAVAATKQHTMMRRWSDLGSKTTGRRDSVRYPRTSSLPQQSPQQF